jgi:hypothetical protein
VSVHQILCKSQKKCDVELEITRQAFREETMGNIRVSEWKSPNSLEPKSQDRLRAKSRACQSFSSASRGKQTNSMVLSLQANYTD